MFILSGHSDEALFQAVNKLAILKEFVNFLHERRRWWIVPIVILLLLLGIMLFLSKGSALAPFIYSLF